MRVLLAIDDSDCSEAAVRAVLEYLKPGDAEVLALHVLEWPKELSTAARFAEGAAAADDVLALHEELRHRGSELAEGTAVRLRSAQFKACAEHREGDPRTIILERASEWHANLIVVGSHGRRGMQRWLLGSVSEAIVRHAACSVAVVRAASTSDQP